MAAVSAPAIQRLAAAAAMPYATVERMTRPLIALDRWPSRARKQLLASDLASLLNAMMGQQTTEAATSDAMLRALEYKSTLPDTTKQAPALGEGTWGDLLERMIRNAPTELYPTLPWTAGMDYSSHLPHDIEACLNPLHMVLVWRHGLTGAPDRLDYYGPAPGDLSPHYPYGLATLLIRKCFLHPRMIVIAGHILRDASPQAIPENETAATLPGEAAARKPGPKAPGSSNTRKTMRALSLSQGQSHDGPGPSPSPRRKIDGRRRHQNTLDAGHVRVARAD